MYMKENDFIHLNIASDIKLNFITKILTRPQLENSGLKRHWSFPLVITTLRWRSCAFSSLQRSIRHVLDAPVVVVWKMCIIYLSWQLLCSILLRYNASQGGAREMPEYSLWTVM